MLAMQFDPSQSKSDALVLVKVSGRRLPDIIGMLLRKRYMQYVSPCIARTRTPLNKPGSSYSGVDILQGL
jgi:hypothetical protein